MVYAPLVQQCGVMVGQYVCAVVIGE